MPEGAGKNPAKHIGFDWSNRFRLGVRILQMGKSSLAKARARRLGYINVRIFERCRANGRNCVRCSQDTRETKRIS